MTLKIYYLRYALFALGMNLFSCKESLDCSLYKLGKFVNYSPLTKEKIIIERTDSLQIETNTKNGEVTINKISWISPCEYQLIALSYRKSLMDKIDTFFMETPIKVKIIGGTPDYYIFTARIDSATKFVERKDTMRLYK